MSASLVASQHGYSENDFHLPFIIKCIVRRYDSLSLTLLVKVR